MIHRRFCLALLALTFSASLAACGGGEGDESTQDADDPSTQAPTVYIKNEATFTDIDQIWAYEAYTGELFHYENLNLHPGETSLALGGLVASQYDFYVIFEDSHRSDGASTKTNDPYNGQPITRSIPRVNPGETAEVQFRY